MANWKRTTVDDLPISQAATLSWLPGIVQGFTTRYGGVSQPPYAALNLGSHVGDDAVAVQANRERVWNAFGFAPSRVAMAEQVHGSRVAVVTEGGAPVSGVDALVTNTPDLLLMLFFADCAPIYIIDPITRAIALVHAGWRGTAADIVGKAVSALQENFGSRPEACLAAVGPCIGAENYEIGPEVAAQFHNNVNLSFANALMPRNEFTGTFTLNLRQIIFAQLLSAGLRAQYVTVSDEDTFRNRRDFFSYRRDGAATGRMAGFLALHSP